MRAQEARTRVTQEEEKEGEEKEDVAIFPLAIPLLAGPGAIATVTTLVAQHKTNHLLYAIPVILSTALTCFVAYWMLKGAVRISKLLGVTGMTVMNRLIGLIIGALAVQFIFDGVKDAFPGLGT
jgi:multiple antibiotic resistance protein